VNRLLRPKSVRHMSVTTATQGLTTAHHETRRHSNKARETGKTQLTGYLRRWQVLGSNLWGLEYAIVAVTCFFSQQGGAVRRRSGTRA
jgi:hypothetical protein